MAQVALYVLATAGGVFAGRAAWTGMRAASPVLTVLMGVLAGAVVAVSVYWLAVFAVLAMIGFGP